MSRFRVTAGGQTLYGLPVPRMPVIQTVESIEGWWNPAPTVGGVQQRSYAHGAWPERVFYGPRTVVIKGAFAGDDPASVRDAAVNFMGYQSAEEFSPLVVEELGATSHVMARLEGTQQVDWKGLRVIRYNLQFISLDYRRFGGTGLEPQYTDTVGLPKSEGGLILPAAPPWLIAATVVSGSVRLANKGNAAPAAVVRISGPVPRPVLFTDDGQRMDFDTDLQAGEFLEIDLDKRTVLLNGQAHRRGVVRGEWINLSAGTNNVLRFDAAAYNTTARMTVSWSDSWK